jgi:endonuclease-3
MAARRTAKTGSRGRPKARRRPRTPSDAERARALEVVRRLDAAMPGARIELDFGSPLQLMVSVILSAQSTDKGVNRVTPGLFAAFPDAAALARAEPEQLWPHIRTLGLFRNKARAIVAASRALGARHGGEVPRTRAELQALPGVGQKSAGVILIQLGVEAAFPVDTHVGRLARRLGFTRQLAPHKVEAALREIFPQDYWAHGHQLLVWHGRRCCTARAPDCERCPVGALCPRIGVRRAAAAAS